jgi:hypothetical protein
MIGNRFLRARMYSYGSHSYSSAGEESFTPISAKPRVVGECDSASSLILEVEDAHGIALVTTILKVVAGHCCPKQPILASSVCRHVHSLRPSMCGRDVSGYGRVGESRNRSPASLIVAALGSNQQQSSKLFGL